MAQFNFDEKGQVPDPISRIEDFLGINQIIWKKLPVLGKTLISNGPYLLKTNIAGFGATIYCDSLKCTWEIGTTVFYNSMTGAGKIQLQGAGPERILWSNKLVSLAAAKRLVEKELRVLARRK